ncbi:hypothetical protein EK21DRAFT_86179 [Setomelanomma holmii]|uniref:Uncharacterized protein n=1 Tax=Setomelanomma holmii TaxID=210430 RepID=A0A9P4HGQ7_9PLEO|nr:hypothetical protein EK21DRAFT_86179 [Setomelanomma holmii]
MSDEDTPQRRSRAKQPQLCRVDEEYSFLDDDASSMPSGAQTPDVEEFQEDEDDFMPDAEEEPEDDFDEDIVDESESEDGEDDEEEYSERRIQRPSTPVLNIIEVDSGRDSAPPSGPGTGRRRKGQEDRPRHKVKVPIHITRGGGVSAKAVGASPLRTRGVADFTKIGGQEVRLKDLFGPRNEDLKPILLTRDHWLRQETLPLRKSGGLRRSFFERAASREKEDETLKNWYANIGRESFRRGLKSRALTVEEAAVHMVTNDSDSINVLLGPVDAPQLHALNKQSYIDVAEPFGQNKNRRGWLFNLGARIQDAQWATNEDGTTQHLAVAVEQRPTSGPQLKPMEQLKAPAFSATKPFPSSIQIWSFEAGTNGELDSSKQPRLRLLICTDWGAPKQFRWCPVSAKLSTSQSDEQNVVHVGLLAGIWSDGRVRILDVSYLRDGEHARGTQYTHISQAVFDVPFPQTVPTCLKWLSGTTIAVATAIGTLAIWTLTKTFTTPETQQSPPRPWLYKQISDTYILTLSSGWPSQPQLISISTADGFARLFDIRTPDADTTASIRGRTLCLTQDWHEQTQSFIAPDEYYMLKHNPIRRYYHNLYSMRAESSITRVASSPVHPGILIGGADGRVEASNPIGRITNYKIIPWQQTWFKHEWRKSVKEKIVQTPDADADTDVEMTEGGPVGDVSEVLSTSGPDIIEQTAPSAPPAPSNAVPRSVLDQPLARITEGYKAFQPGIQHSVTSKKAANPEVGKGITIYEEPSAITALAWNPNLKFGTWAVAGMGDGLLRVEDVAV